MKRLVVTGAKGFVGSIVALRAAENGWQVLALDDESRGLNPIEERIGADYQRFDCMNGIEDAAAARGWGEVDAVIHLAAATGSLERPLDELVAMNVGMTQAVYNDALKLGATSFLWPTTSLAIGVPDSPYVKSKEMALEWLREVDATARISQPVRFFNMTGAYKGLTERRKNEVHIVPMMLKAHLARETFVINGADYATVDGTPSRDYTNVVDAADALLAIASGMVQGRSPVQPYDDGAVWLASGRSTTVMELVQQFETITGSHLSTRIGGRRPFDCGALIADAKQVEQFNELCRGLTPSRVSFRDEVLALLDQGQAAALRAIRNGLASQWLTEEERQGLSALDGIIAKLPG